MGQEQVNGGVVAARQLAEVFTPFQDLAPAGQGLSLALEKRPELAPGQVDPKDQLLIARNEAGHPVAFLPVGCGAVMQDTGAWLVNAAQARPTEAESQVGVFEVGAELRQQQACFLQSRPPIKAG